jgi:Ala-tRNA(Pro) deacylase
VEAIDKEVEMSTTHAAGTVGDLIVVGGHRVGDAGRTGEILEVVGGPGHERYRVRWADGHESLFTPGTDAFVRHAAGRRPATLLEHELTGAGVAFEALPHGRIESAGEEARILDVGPEEVAKTIVVHTGDGYVRAVIPASERLDLRKLRASLGADKETRLATEPELAAAYPEFELGAVPPFGGPAGDRVVVDARLAERESVVLEAGEHDESVRLAVPDLVRITRAEVLDVVAD